MRVIARRERPHPGAQLRVIDHDGWRVTCFATNTRGSGWTLDALQVRHRQRARGLKDTGMRNLPFHGYAQNQIWLEIVALAADLLAWTQTLARDEYEPPPLGTHTTATADPRHRQTYHPQRAPPPTPTLRLPRNRLWNHLIDMGGPHSNPSESTAHSYDQER